MEAKKRGRKPKPKTEELDSVDTNNNNNSQPNNLIIPESFESEEVVQKKRGRKPKPKDLNEVLPNKKTNIDKKDASIVINKFVECSLDFGLKGVDKEIPSNIVHLPIAEDSIDNIIENNNLNLNGYDNNVPNWYSKINCEPNEHVNELDNNNEINKTSENNELRLKNLLESRKNDIDTYSNKTNCQDIRKPVDYTMFQFKECNKTRSWPHKTNVLCFNCCHSFNHTPACLPIRYQNGIFYVYGCFCYPECAAGFNFSDTIFLGNKHENYNLLNLLYKKLYNDSNYKVKIASHRTVLKMFGGNTTIEDYRQSFNNPHTSYTLIMPPMLSIIPLQEEHNIIYYKKNHQSTIHNNNKGYDGAYKNKDKDYVLKRSKPIINKTYTLDNCMNIFTEQSSKSESLNS